MRVIVILASSLFFAAILIRNSSYYFAGRYRVSNELAPLSSLPPGDRRKIAIIGGAGYVGSYLTNFLRSEKLQVTVFDKRPQIPDFDAIAKHSEAISSEELQEFGVVIFLGGCTGRRACAALSVSDREKENVYNVVDLVKKLDSAQHLVAASTSAVLEGREHGTETDPVNWSLLDEYSSSMFKRETTLRELVTESSSSLPRVSLLRFGTVVGNSLGQRTDLMVPSFFRAAYAKGVLQVQSPEVSRSFLHLNDLSRAIHALISSSKLGSIDKFQVWNLPSFSATVLKVATTISTITGATIDVSKEEAKKHLKPYSVKDFSGFSLNGTSFSNLFNFSFEEDLLSTLTELDKHIPESIIAKGPHAEEESHGGSTMACPVCGATNQQTVLDLNSQPSANDMRKDAKSALASPRFPLRLVRCRKCNHYHLSYIVDRSDLFQTYLYQSGTSSTLANYFEWLAQKVVNESGLTSSQKGNILEIACNDGSQLDHYKQFKWGTYGVDPAANLVKFAAAKNHTVKNGFWPTEFPALPKGDALTAITAQNVAAHVPDVVAFLKGCANIMGPRTRLYIQTSQCNMQQLGQFDTVYHEHISFFTGHSFLKASELAGLHIIKFETTPIHGESCLVTMQLKEAASDPISHSPSLSKRLHEEQKDGIASEFYAAKFSARANGIRDWIKNEVLIFRSKGYTVGAYAAAAKGMVLLHFMLNKDDGDATSLLEFVLDDAPLKQDTYCPGTAIPVKKTDSLLTLDAKKPLALLIFAWNFYEEIAQRVKAALKGLRNDILFIVPFPTPKLIKVRIDKDDPPQVLRGMPYNPTPMPNPLRDSTRRKVVLLSHQRNEKLLMPYFIMHHAPMFDSAVLIDFLSDDGETLEMIQKFAPPSWQVVNSSVGKEFVASALDEQVAQLEKAYDDDWVIALTTTEFLVKPNLRSVLHEKKKEYGSSAAISHINAIRMIGYETEPLAYLAPLPKQRTNYQLGPLDGFKKDIYYARFLHTKTCKTHHYELGRHKYAGPGNVSNLSLEDAFIMKWMWTPWPEQRKRKMSVGLTIPAADKAQNLGIQHTGLTNLSDPEVDLVRNNNIKGWEHTDLCDFNDPHHRSFHNAFGTCY